MPKRRRNPQEFTIDEARTAQNIIDEGSFFCHGRMDKRPYYYPEIKISMCVKEALEPASRVFRTSIRADRVKTVVCPLNSSPQTDAEDGQSASWVHQPNESWKGLNPSSPNTIKDNGKP